MSTTFSDSYKTKSGSADVIQLTVVIGFAQTAATNISLDGKVIAVPGTDEDGKPVTPDDNDNYPQTFKIPLGTNEECKGKILLVDSIITRTTNNDNLSLIVTP